MARKLTAFPQKKTAKGRYDQLLIARTIYTSRAEECAKLTIPRLFPPQGSNSATEFYTPFQGVGAEGVNNLAAKQMLALFPPGSAFFRLTLDDFVLKQLAEEAGEGDFDNARAQFEDALARLERAVMTRFEQNGARMPLFEALQQLTVAGNVLLHILPTGKVKLFRLDKYVVKRDAEGNPLEIITMEKLDKETLPPELQAVADAEAGKEDEQECELFTRVWRKDGKWHVAQELCGHFLPQTYGTYPLDKLPWLPLRFNAIAGEDYGRGFVEDRLGDLRSLESLTQSLVEGTAIAAKVLIGVNENGVTSKKAVAESPNGAVIDGDLEKDVKVLQIGKQADFATAQAEIQVIQKRLERAFLLLSGVQRDAERVTAEEVRAVVAELETTLGGFYSTFSQELQYPLVSCLLAQGARAGQLPHLPKGTVAPQIVTGLDGLGRSSDLGKLDALSERLVKLLGPEGCAQRLNVDAYVKLAGAALGGDYKGLVRSDAEMQQEAQAAQQAEVAKAAIGPGIKAISDHAMAAQPQGENG